MALKKRLKEAIPEIKHIGIWNENMGDLPGGMVFDTPAVFVEFSPVTFSGAGQGSPRASMEIALHLVHKYVPEDPQELIDTEDYKRPDYLDDPLEYLDLMERLEVAPIGLSGTGFSGLQLMSSDLDHEHGELMHHLVIYSTGVAYSMVPATRGNSGLSAKLQGSIRLE